MPRKCGACTHPDVEQINVALLTEPERSVARRFGLTASSVHRHRAEHLGRALAAARRQVRTVPAQAVEQGEAAPSERTQATEVVAQEQARREVEHGDDLLGRVEKLCGRTEAILDRAEQNGDDKLALGAVKEVRGTLQLLAEMMGEIRRGDTVNVLLASPEWIHARERIVEAIPEGSRLQVVETLEALEKGEP